MTLAELANRFGGRVSDLLAKARLHLAACEQCGALELDDDPAELCETGRGFSAEVQALEDELESAAQ